ncbi:hypothetical protein [Pseudomonas sp. 2hn]|uniref:hypothetical protein n=1 Tax=Pseudomonas sp. 2hn TaxID=2866626 RepID=UPI001C7DB7EE|nr:hypothetical protein [Pseudomonas sp. 2hn]QZA52588.1 hypothetical protein K2O50_16325 [Pseudomonas sp. 2hn]
MAFHTRKNEVERLARRLTERYEALIKVREGREGTNLVANGNEHHEVQGLWVRGEDIRFAVDDVTTALKEIKSRLGKD